MTELTETQVERMNMKIYQAQYYLENREQIRMVHREYSSKRENKDKRNVYLRAYYKANKEAFLKKRREFYNANKDALKAKRLEKIAKSRQTQEFVPSTSATSL